MASGKEIRTQIKSIQNTQKITKAMEMVAASKMRKAQDRMRANRPYSLKLREVVGHIASANVEYKHPYLINRPDPKRVGYIVVSTDRGLCGGLNTNIFKAAVSSMKQWSEQDVEIEICTIGKKALSFFRGVGANIVGSTTDLGDAPELSTLLGSIRIMLDKYDSGEIDRLFVVENEFVNTMTQKPEALQLLPLQAGDTGERKGPWDYIYEPEAKEILDMLLIRYVESQVYQGVVENNACEQAARMVAMKSATDNAGELIEDLELIYNKARQAAITQELSEIVSGASAV